jgi:hypothetical protein
VRACVRACAYVSCAGFYADFGLRCGAPSSAAHQRPHLHRDSRTSVPGLAWGPTGARLRLPVLLWQRMRRAATVGGALDAFSLVRARSEVESRLLADVSGAADSPEWADGAGRRSRPAGSQLRSLNRGYLTPDREKPPWVLAPLHRWRCACSLGAVCVECG